MSETVTHRLVGYDHVSGRVVVEYDVPDHLLEFAKRLANVGDDDPQAVLCYRLDDREAQVLATEIGAKIEADRFSFYFEGFAGSVSALDERRSSNALATETRLLREVKALREQQRGRERKKNQ